MKKILPLLAIVAGLYWTYEGAATYRLWANGRLGGGFMPALAGATTVLFAVILLCRKEGPGAKTEEAFDPRMLLPVGALGLVVAGAHLVGFIPAMVLFVYCWLNMYERYSFRKSAFTAAATGFVVYAIFSHWLALPFPRGMLNLV